MARAPARAVRARGGSRGRARRRRPRGVAAGMLAPVTEADFGEEGPLRVNLAGARALAGVRRRARGGHRPADRLPRQRRAGRGRRPRRRRGAAPPARLPALARPRRRSGSRRRAAGALEPGLSPRIAGGILAPQDGQADPRATVRALAAAVEEVALGVEVEAIEHEGGRGDAACAPRAGTIACERGGGGRRALERRARARRRRPAGAAGEGPDPRAAHARRDAGAVRARAAHAALLPRGARRRARGARRDGGGAGLRHRRDGRRRLPAARGGLGGAARGGRAGAGRAPAPGCGRARRTTRRSWVRASWTAWCGPPATGATACCSRRSRAMWWPACSRASRCPRSSRR